MAKGWFFIVEGRSGPQPYRAAIADELAARHAVMKECTDGSITFSRPLDETGLDAGTVAASRFSIRDQDQSQSAGSLRSLAKRADATDEWSTGTKVIANLLSWRI
ncbi:hypothetical protein [Zhengella mangrovi]|uniref:hypothetical protein n=1 Tax=Zhengella mangrovi TaxID=1982044 RepID=UPI0010568253|nr:hypothetical protein [Zhengella mangrovi]